MEHGCVSCPRHLCWQPFLPEPSHTPLPSCAPRVQGICSEILRDVGARKLALRLAQK